MYLIATTIDFHRPLLWAVLIGWILTVVLHEFAHGIVAYWGGDYTIRERGGLTLNPLQYVDPVMSLLLPALFLLMGGIPLPGGSTYVRRDLLRSKGWSAAVSLAGPAMNFILFFAFVLPLHPRFGWLNPMDDSDAWTNGQIFCGAMATLQFMSVILNLIPIPPLDGFQATAVYMDEEQRTKLATPPVSTALFIGFFLVLWYYQPFMEAIYSMMMRLLLSTGFGENCVRPLQFLGRALYGP